MRAGLETTILFLGAPPDWVIALVVLPATALFAWWSYGGLRRLELPTRITLSVLRWLALLVCCVLLFQPAFKWTTYRRTQNQVHVLVVTPERGLRGDEHLEAGCERAQPGDHRARRGPDMVGVVEHEQVGLRGEGDADRGEEVVVAGHWPPATAGSTTTWSPSLSGASRPPMKRTSSSLM